MSKMFTTRKNPGHAGFVNVRRSAGRFVVEIGCRGAAPTGELSYSDTIATTLSDAEAAELVTFLTKKRRH